LGQPAQPSGLPYGKIRGCCCRDFVPVRGGGYPDQPLMEDVALVARLARGKLVG